MFFTLVTLITLITLVTLVTLNSLCSLNSLNILDEQHAPRSKSERPLKFILEVLTVSFQGATWCKGVQPGLSCTFNYIKLYKITLAARCNGFPWIRTPLKFILDVFYPSYLDYLEYLG